MILFGSYGVDAFLARLSTVLTGDPTGRKSEPKDEGGLHKVVYFGAGYWRGLLIEGAGGKFIAIGLVNPDKPGRDIDLIEKAIPVLFGMGTEFCDYPKSWT